MPAPNPPDLDTLLRSYERSLIARVQLSEFQSWGDTITAHFRQAVADHVELEQAYLADVIIRRRAHGS